LAILLTMGIPTSCPALPAEAHQQGIQPEKTGKDLYMASCAACHGANGIGSDKARVGFDLGLPDFTDCNFASREPDADWIAIAHQGGPVRGFSRIMPAFGDAHAINELEMIVAHIREFCGNEDWPRGELNLPRLLVTEKAFPEDEAVYSLGMNAEGEGAVSSKIVYEKRFGAAISLNWSSPLDGRNRETPASVQCKRATGQAVWGISRLAPSESWFTVRGPVPFSVQPEKLYSRREIEIRVSAKAPPYSNLLFLSARSCLPSSFFRRRPASSFPRIRTGQTAKDSGVSPWGAHLTRHGLAVRGLPCLNCSARANLWRASRSNGISFRSFRSL